MATITKAELRDRVLQHIGVLAAGQSASADDAALVESSIDAAHDELKKLGLAPFATSAIPEWAQPGMRDYVAADVKPSFGIAVNTAAEQALAERRLGRQVSGSKPHKRVKVEWF